MWKFAVIACLALALTAGPALASHAGKGWRGGGGSYAQGNGPPPFAAPQWQREDDERGRRNGERKRSRDDRRWRRDKEPRWRDRSRDRRNPGWGGRNRAREGVKRGEILSLDRVLNTVQRRYPGRLLDVHLDSRRLIYHLRLLTRRGRVLKINVDARNARILSVTGNRERGRGRSRDRSNRDWR